jgi:glycosyltransferase involved in cell wall biosynthesis
MKDTPLVSVVMPTYNDVPYLREAIDSVLSQTYPHFEFIIVNDGSTDTTGEILASYKDDRIKLITLEKNHGNANARNMGLDQAKGEFIAFFDSDDIMHRERLAAQSAFLAANPTIDFVGSAMVRFNGEQWYYQFFPKSPRYIRAAFFFRSMLMQPSVMARSQSITRHGLRYNTNYPIGSDTHFFYQATRLGCRLTALDKPLLYYRVSDSQISRMSELERHKELFKDFLSEKLASLGLLFSNEELDTLYQFTFTRIPMTREKYLTLTKLFDAIERQNEILRIYSRPHFRAALLFYRIRLIKYEFLEKGRSVSFLSSLMKLYFQSGTRAFLIFWKNEGKQIRKGGENHAYFSRLPL